MAMQIAGVVGAQGVGDGSTNVPFRQGKTGELIDSKLHGSFYELTSRGQVYSGMTAVAGTTIVANNASPVGAAVASIFTIYNPVNSGINVEVLKTWLCHISGTPAAGAFVYNLGFNQVITATQNNGGTSGATSQSNNAGSSGGIAKVFTQTALTGSTLQSLLRPIGSQFAGAIAATTPGQTMFDLVDGEIVLPPGGCLTIASPGTGTSHIVTAGMTWAEVKL